MHLGVVLALVIVVILVFYLCWVMIQKKRSENLVATMELERKEIQVEAPPALPFFGEDNDEKLQKIIKSNETSQ